MPKYDESDDEDDEDEIESPFDFFKIFTEPDKLFNNKQFKRLFKEIFEQIAKGGLLPEFHNLSPEDFKEAFLKNRDKFKFKGPFMYGFNVGIGPDGNLYTQNQDSSVGREDGRRVLNEESLLREVYLPSQLF